jgi:acetyl-CoA carboxylase biotin carboxyl carrier protein
MAELGISAEELRQLARLVEENGLSELRLEEGDLRVTLRTASYRANFAPVAVAASVVAPAASENGVATDDAFVAAPPAAPTANLLQIEAPIMGVFYRTAAPSEPPLIEVGDTIEVGQVIGIIEAMKVFSEIPADRAGRVIEIPAKNGGLVQPGDPLVVLEAV